MANNLLWIHEGAELASPANRGSRSPAHRQETPGKSDGWGTRVVGRSKGGPSAGVPLIYLDSCAASFAGTFLS